MKLKIRAQFHGLAYRKQRINACGSGEFCAYVKRISRVIGEFVHVRMRIPLYEALYTYTASSKRRMVILTTEFGSYKSYDIEPRLPTFQ